MLCLLFFAILVLGFVYSTRLCLLFFSIWTQKCKQKEEVSRARKFLANVSMWTNAYVFGALKLTKASDSEPEIMHENQTFERYGYIQKCSIWNWFPLFYFSVL